ncbi:MAG TPA: potassium-transporting ATPase subunit B, partial [Ignavibacteria bacterium]|nr:potassium-transporting ATPase subunit B [Ignavibacteria bacterium]
MSKHPRVSKLFQKDLVAKALKDSFKKLNPAAMIKNPVMFVVEIGTFIMLVLSIYLLFRPDAVQGSFMYNLIITLILFLTVLFANFVEALAEARGKAQAETLRKTRQETPANIILPNGEIKSVMSSDLKKGDVFVASAGELIATDGEIIEGIATIDESAITGESAPVIREAGGDRSGVTGGTRVLTDSIKV